VSLLPKEHGAYGQMAFPLVTSLAVAGVTAPALLIALAIVAAFLAHEPLLLLLGRRGERMKRREWPRALAWLGITSATAAGAGAAAWWTMAPHIRWALLLLLGPALVIGAMITRQRERSALGEMAVALAFSLAAVPVCLAAGAPASTGLAVGIAFAVTFVTGTLGVRAIVATRRGRDLASSSTRRNLLALATGAGAALAVAASRMVLPWATLLAAAPGLAVATSLALFPPSPKRLRTVGWTLVAVSAGAALILIAALTGAGPPGGQ
jgi:hypothetical protein